MRGCSRRTRHIVDGSHDGDGKFSARQRNRILELKQAAQEMETMLASLPGEESSSQDEGFKHLCDNKSFLLWLARELPRRVRFVRSIGVTSPYRSSNRVLANEKRILATLPGISSHSRLSRRSPMAASSQFIAAQQT